MEFQRNDNRLDEEILVSKLPSGLTMILNPKKGFSKTMGLMGIRFGSADNIIPAGPDIPAKRDGSTRRVPDGTAQFLEHKLFENADGDVSDRFAANGAQCNASTGFCTTSYMFSCTDRVEEDLRLLLSFVQEPYFTEELVRKEQGIIGQEISMYEDDPDWIVFFNLMALLFREHPVRHNIAGSAESIAEITPAFLKECYRAFYRPGNMVLVLSGGFDPDRAGEAALHDAGNRPADREGPNKRFFRESVPTPLARERFANMVVARPKFLMGFKEASLLKSGRDIETAEIKTQMILDIIFGRSSPWYESLYKDEIVDDSFSASYSCYGDFGFTLIGADTEHPDRLRGRLVEIFDKVRAGGIAGEDFERIRNKYQGKCIRMFNSVESTAYSLLGCFFRGFCPSELVDLVGRITLDEINERLVSAFDPDLMATSIVLPVAKGD